MSTVAMMCNQLSLSVASLVGNGDLGGAAGGGGGERRLQSLSPAGYHHSAATIIFSWERRGAG